MPWTDIFKGKSRDTAADPRIRWFGKLPTYADYYSSRNDEDWAVEFNDWIMKGYQFYHAQSRAHSADGQEGTRASDAPRRMPISTCIVRLPGSQMTVFATIQDYGGDMRGRPFPVCFYVGVPTSQWLGPPSELMMGAERALTDLVALRDQVTRFCNAPGNFESLFGDREVTIEDINGATRDAAWSQEAAKLPLAEWFDGAKNGLKVQDPAQWYRLLASWGRSIAEQDPASFQPTLRFPLAIRLPIDIQLAGWLRWLESRMDLARRPASLVVSGRRKDNVGDVTVIAREVIADDFLLMTPLWSALPYVDDAAGLVETAESAPQDQAQPGPAEPLTEPTATWADLVAR